MVHNTWIPITVDGRKYEALEYDHGLFRIRREDQTVIGEVARLSAAGNRKEQIKILDETGTLMPTWTGAIRELDLRSHEQAPPAAPGITVHAGQAEPVIIPAPAALPPGRAPAPTVLPRRRGPNYRVDPDALPAATPGWLTVLQAAQAYGVSDSEIYARIKTDQIACQRVKNDIGAKGRNWRWEVKPPGLELPADWRPANPAILPPSERALARVAERAGSAVPLPRPASPAAPGPELPVLDGGLMQLLLLVQQERAEWLRQIATLHERAREDAQKIGALEQELRTLRPGTRPAPEPTPPRFALEDKYRNGYGGGAPVPPRPGRS